MEMLVACDREPERSMPRYRGNTSVTRWPSRTNAFGSAATTSARPPVLAYGCASDATIRIDSGGRLGLDARFGSFFAGISGGGVVGAVRRGLGEDFAAGAGTAAVSGAGSGFLLERATGSGRDEVLR